MVCVCVCEVLSRGYGTSWIEKLEERITEPRSSNFPQDLAFNSIALQSLLAHDGACQWKGRVPANRKSRRKS